jgi:hypothetical protein
MSASPGLRGLGNYRAQKVRLANGWTFNSFRERDAD